MFKEFLPKVVHLRLRCSEKVGIYYVKTKYKTVLSPMFLAGFLIPTAPKSEGWVMKPL
jgi:hypothetical protein